MSDKAGAARWKTLKRKKIADRAGDVRSLTLEEKNIRPGFPAATQFWGKRLLLGGKQTGNVGWGEKGSGRETYMIYLD